MFSCIAAFLLLFLFPYNEAAKSTVSARYELTESLLKNYPKDGVVTVPTEKLVVKVRINVYSIFGLNENEIMEMNGWVKVVWTDPRLKWKPEDWSGVVSVVVPASKVWKPDVGIANSKQAESKDFSQNDKLKVEIKSTGEASYLSYFLSETPCPIDTAMFPFDRQKCPFILSSYFSRMSDFQIKVSSITAPQLTDDSVSQWKLVLYDTEDFFAGEGEFEDETFQMVRVSFHLKRKPMYHVVLVIVPYCLICLVGAIMFVIKEPGERFGISLTILLAMSVYVMIVAQGAPKSMDTLSLLDVFLLVQMTLLVLLTFVIVVGPVMFTSEKDKTYEEGEEEEVEENLNTENNVVAIERRPTRRCVGGRLCGWSRKCDFISLAFYLLTSVINGVVCLCILNKFKNAKK